MAVKDFDPDCGDSAYTMGIVDLLLECVELSYRPGKYSLHQYRALNMLCSYEKCNVRVEHSAVTLYMGM